LSQPQDQVEPNPAGPDAVGFVLAGGRSSRMGQDKALVQLADQPLISHALGILRTAGLAASVAGANSPLEAFAPVVEDSQPGLGPLSGICAALASTSMPTAVFLSVDLPLLPVSLVVFLLHYAKVTGSAVTVPSINGFAQTFPAVIDRSALSALLCELEAGRRGCFSAFQAATAKMGQRLSILAVELLVQSGQIAHPDGVPAARWFLNVNTPADLLCAEAHCQALIG
jgi:molybdopterin-guanine dinucleotide biosynthesis protein A